ncbi:MAG: TlpA family protein disulfide reductase [Pseudomonadales bacterium]|nr:TlpA family protein disulfide reductase [Pseudomonadales bacterium]
MLRPNRFPRWQLPPVVVCIALAMNAGAADDWKLVQAYLDLDTAWHAKDREIRDAEVSTEEKERQRTEELGEHPDIVLAVAAARSIVQAGDKRAVEAAEFLVQHPMGLSPTAQADIEFGMAALVDLIGPDWSVVEDYQDQHGGRWSQLLSFFSTERTALQALAAASAIVDLGGEHDNTVQAAEFLIENAGFARGGNTAHVVKGIETLTNTAGYGNWQQTLMHLDRAGSTDFNDEIEGLLDDLADGAEDPLVQATARYYAASRLARMINSASTEERDAHRERALALTEGLSTGIEDEEFVAKVSTADGPASQTFVDVERDLLSTIRYATVGGTVSDLRGQRLDGVEETLDAYGNQVVLVDFWATWCGPCIAGLPKLRELVAELPAEEFEILSISIDQELESVTEFQLDEPMPWAQWHVGVGSELARTWQVRGIPTYVLVDREGRILAKGHSLDDDLIAMLKDAVVDATEDSEVAGSEETVDA